MMQPLPPPATGIRMIVSPPPAQHCADTIRATYDDEFERGAPLTLHITRDGPYALVGWEIGEAGGMSVLHQDGSTWCRVVSGGGAMDEADIAAIDGIGNARARRLLRGKPTMETEHAR